MPDQDEPDRRTAERQTTDRRTAEREAAERQAADDAERRRRRAQFLRELNEAKALRDRVQPRRARAARMRHALRMRTFRW
ncbi:hypothetical protein BJP40_08610 [Streptomyces sp. CC53]|uniref:hypothetical protein n=1 Tax=unclassified Streptomyces TaxID=2593676 RepID=UPI0008DCAB2B|nr:MULTISPECIES: hypothetical protein [unclassified Streptomyces]OII60976.1 hypothetical protein BJP40_08610 [Streptomyces sp. CC53]OII68360.1 hypothetical protein BJP39_21770 [Streptomyces sp. CC77]